MKITHVINGYNGEGHLLYRGTRYVAISDGVLYENMYSVKDFVDQAMKTPGVVRAEALGLWGTRGDR